MEDKTIEIRWHGRGGQGAVTSAELLALAAITEGKYAQAMPSFGAERRGAPVLAFNRVNSSRPIRARYGVTEPDIVVVLDPGLLEVIDVTDGLKKDGKIIINTAKDINELKLMFNGSWTLAVVDASAIAKETLGVNIVNTTMLGAVIKTSPIIKMKSLEEPIMERFSARAKNNIDACKKAYEKTTITQLVPSGAQIKRDFQVEKLPTWKEILPGCVIIEPGNAKQYRTGDWRSASPVYDYEKCNKCGLCFIYCPEGCIRPREDGYFAENLYYCKGCGICAKECPKKAITMQEVR